MRTIAVVAVFVLVQLFFGSLASFAQTSSSRQQQIELHTRKAAEYLKQNQADLAVPEFRAIIAVDPKNADAHGNLGAVFFFQGAYAEAIPELRAALRLRPTLWKTEALLGIAEKRTGHVEAARHDLDKSFPNLTEEKIRVQTGMELIEIDSATGNLDKAAAAVGALRELEPANGAILYAAYRIYSDLADESLLSLSVVEPKSARMHQALAHELAKRGRTAEAIENYRAALNLDSQLPGIHFELAEMLNTLGTEESRQEAEREYRAALTANPMDEQSERRLGEIAFQAGDLKAATDHYNRAIQLQPNNPEASIGLAKVLMSLNQTQKAEALLHHALELDPTSAVAHFRLSTIYRQTGRAEDAQRELAEYQKYKGMKEKLREVYGDLHRDQTGDENDDSNRK